MFRKLFSRQLLTLIVVLLTVSAALGKAEPVTIESPDTQLVVTFYEADDTSAARYSLCL